MNLYDHVRAALNSTEGHQRFILTIGAAAVCSIHLERHVLSESGFVTIILATVAVFIGAGAAEKVSANNANSRIEVAKATGVNPPVPAVVVSGPPTAVVSSQDQR